MHYFKLLRHVIGSVFKNATPFQTALIISLLIIISLFAVISVVQIIIPFTYIAI